MTVGSTQAPESDPNKHLEPPRVGASERGDKLSVSASLSTTSIADHKSATGRVTPDTSATHLPEVKVSVRGDKRVIQAHKELADLVIKSFPDKSAEAKFTDSMDVFEARATVQQLTPDQVAQTYKEVEVILQPAPDSPVSSEQRKLLAGQWMAHIADPYGTTKQGWHDTCAWTYLETRLLVKDPEAISEKFAQVVTTGNVTTLDIAEAERMNANGDTDGGVPIKVLSLDKGSLQPDKEAQGLSSHPDRRDYADQIAQVMEGNMGWALKEKDPKGDNVEPGSMSYHQCENIVRPGDSKSNPKLDQSCESVSYTDPKSGKMLTEDAGGYGYGGAATTTDVATVGAIITGRGENLFLAKAHPGKIYRGDEGITSLKDFHDHLQQLKTNNQLPFAVYVDLSKPGIVEDLHVRSPNKDLKTLSPIASHALVITDVGANGELNIYNPWGSQKKISESMLYKAMSK